jgi:predicted permease
MLQVLGDVILPVFLIVSVGYVIGRWKGIAPAPLSQTVFYLFSPALGFSSLTSGALVGSDAIKIIIFVFASMGIMLTICTATARALRMESDRTSAFLLGAAFSNAGNFGLPIAQFAFGQEGFTYAVAYFVVHSMFTQPLAVFIASHGQANLRQSLLNVLKTPVLYSALLAIIVSVFAIPLPGFVVKGTALLGAATVPAMLVVLGLQLREARVTEEVGTISLATVYKLIVAPIAALGLSTLLQMSQLVQNVMILQAAMPTAVFTVIIATEFGVKPRMVTAVVLVTTLASVLTLTTLITLLTGGAVHPG